MQMPQHPDWTLPNPDALLTLRGHPCRTTSLCCPR